MNREQKLEEALNMARSWMHCVEPRLMDTPNFRRDMEALDAALSAPKAEAVEEDGIIECDEILQSLIDNIRSKGNYSPETTITFLNQARQALYTSPVPALTDEAVERAVEAIEGELDGVAATKEQARTILEYALLAAFPSKGGAR